MILNLKFEDQANKAMSRLDWLIENEKKIDLREVRGKRSNSQNRYFYLLVSFFGIQTGYNVEEVKQLIKYEPHLCRSIFVYDKKGQAFARSTADLDTKEMSVVIEKFRNWSNAECGIYLPSANEEDFLDSIANEIEEYENKVHL